MALEVDCAPQGSAQQAAEEFTLDITFSGLCLLVQQPNARKLLVLLPHAHADNSGRPEHRAVLGAHARYKPEGFEQKGRVFESDLSEGKGELAFYPPLTVIKAPDFDLLETFEVVNLTKVAPNRPPIPQNALLTMKIGSGEVCPDCAHDSGATWLFNWEKQRMATRIGWRITGLKNTVGGRPGIGIRYKSGGQERLFVVRPVKEKENGLPEPKDTFRAAFYLYHTPVDELPSHAGHPVQPEDEPEVNHHFEAYYSLFDPMISAPLPELVPDEEVEDDEDDDDAAGDIQASSGEPTSGIAPICMVQSQSFTDNALRYDAARLHGGAGFHGRLYTCTIATAEDNKTGATVTGTSSAQPIDPAPQAVTDVEGPGDEALAASTAQENQ